MGGNLYKYKLWSKWEVLFKDMIIYAPLIVIIIVTTVTVVTMVTMVTVVFGYHG